MASKTETLMKLETRVVDTAFEPIRSLRVELEQSDTEARWYRDLLLCLVNSTLREHLNLKIGCQRSTAFLSWACRNLLELSILAKYVGLSEKHAKRLVGDRIIDGIDLFESFEAWYAYVDPQRQQPELGQILARLRAQKAKAGLPETKFLRANELAKSVGMETEFRHMNKVCSKFIHPTAWSVLNALNECELRGMRSILLTSGVTYGLRICTTLRSHINSFGVKPA
jgi:hypothetical protein